MNIKSKNIVIYPVGDRVIGVNGTEYRPESYLGKLNLEENITRSKTNLVDNKNYVLNTNNILSLDGNKLTLNENKFVINGYVVNILKPFTTTLTSYFSSTDLLIYLSIKVLDVGYRINNETSIGTKELQGIDTATGIYTGVNLLTSSTMINEEGDHIYNLILGIVHYDLDNGWILSKNTNLSNKQKFNNMMINDVQYQGNVLGNNWFNDFILDDGEI